MDTPIRGRGKNKVFWKDDEVDELVETLQELAADPLWKVDGGFKNNYMVEVHKRLLLKRPDFDKSVMPHIDSKIKWLKLKYNPISEMCMQSGCQWDDVECKINCEKQWYDEWCMNHKNAVGLWNVKFPYLRKVDMVWGKDRATGLKAEDIFEATIGADIPNMTLCSSDDDEYTVVTGEQGSAANTSSCRASKKQKKTSPTESFYKRKKTTLQETIDTKFDNFTDKFESVCSQMTSQYAAVTHALISESKSNTLDEAKMQEVINELLNLGISPVDIGRAAEICYNDPAKVQVLFALPSHLRVSFVLGFIHPTSKP
ncbi:hypothetical protein OROHE_019999 [Orobanche hederae]